VGTLSALAGVGAGAGLVMGGVVSDAFGYRFVFVAGAVPALVAALIAHRVLPASTVRAEGRVDVVGAVGLAVGLALPLLAMTQTVRWGWLSWQTAAMLGAGAAVLALFVVHTRRSADPLIDLTTLARPLVRRTNAATLLTSVAMYTPFLLIPTIAQAPTSRGYGLGLTATVAGLLLVPGALVSLGSGPLTGYCVRRWGTRLPLLLGAALQTSGLVGLALAHGSVRTILLLAPVASFGTGLAFAAMPNLIFDAVEPEQTGQSTGVNAVVRTIGVALGAQLTAVLLSGLTTAAGTPRDAAIRVAFLVGGTASLLGGVVALRLPGRPHPPVESSRAGVLAVPAEPVGLLAART
jgi:MFS family permease